jgi:hypothetical protein
MAQQGVCRELSGLLEPSGLLGLLMPQPPSCEQRWLIMHSRRGPTSHSQLQFSAVSALPWWCYVSKFAGVSMASNESECIPQVKELESENGQLHRRLASLEAAAAEQGRSHAALETQASLSVCTTCYQRNVRALPSCTG